MLTAQLTQIAQDLILAAPSPAPDPGTGVTVNTNGFIQFLITQILPIFLVVLGILFVGRARSGNVSSVMTGSGIAIVGLVFIAGAGVMWKFGDFFVGLILS